VSDGSDIAFKVLNIHRIESDDGDVQADIGLREFITKKIFPRRFSEHIFKAIERLEEREYIILVCFLSRCKAALVDTDN